MSHEVEVNYTHEIFWRTFMLHRMSAGIAAGNSRRPQTSPKQVHMCQQQFPQVQVVCAHGVCGRALEVSERCALLLSCLLTEAKLPSLF